ncbi:MAG: ABC transporter ATP-binding protein [Desulfobacterales bacterium]|nr:MAG: ABC transporter ATP-binding protein [Desulfobacterales bacterium]
MKGLETVKYIVQLKDVSKTFGSNEHTTTAVRNVSLLASSEEFIVLFGPSGSGKTTLLTLIAGLVKSTSGTISLFDRSIEDYSSLELQQIRATRIGFIFQTFLLIDSLRVIENITLVLRFAGKNKKEAQRHACRLLQRLQIDHLAKKFPKTLSQGEKQRVAVARALANKPDLIIADEPTGSLETRQGFDIIRNLNEYSKEQNSCVIVASHDMRMADHADRILHLRDGVLL